MYAYVRFIDDNKCCIVDTVDIKHFNKNNYKTSSKYKIKFHEDNNYYDANIIYVSDSIQELQNLINKKRIKHINKKFLVTDCETGDDDDSDKGLQSNKNDEFEKITLAKKEKKAKTMKTTSIENSQLKIMKEFFKSGRIQDSSLSEKAHLSNIVYTKENENEIDNCVQCKHKLEKIKKMQRNIDELRDLNFKLQHNVIELHKDFVGKLNLHQAEDTAHRTPEVGEVVKDKVHLGRNVFLDKDSYHYCFNKGEPGPSGAFVKELALSLFGAGTLAKSSVSGKSTNRFKGAVAKPPLNPTKIRAICDTYEHYLQKHGCEKSLISAEIKKVGFYVGSKIADLNREKKPTSKKNLSELPNMSEPIKIDNESSNNDEEESD